MIRNNINRKIFIAIVLSYMISPAMMAATYELDLEKEVSGFNDGFFPLDTLEHIQPESGNNNHAEILELIKNDKKFEAKQKIDYLISEFPDEPEFYNLRGLLETLDKHFISAELSYKKAIQLDASNLRAYQSLAQLALEKGDDSKASDYSNKALAIDATSVKTYLLLAEIANLKKDFKGAENIILDAIKKVKGDENKVVQLTSNLAKYYIFHKQPVKSLKLSENLVQQFPDNNNALSTLAWAQIINHKNDSAERTLQTIISNNRLDVKHRLLLGRLLISQQKKTEYVLRLFDEASYLEPNNPESLAYKTVFLIKLKRYHDAFLTTDIIEWKFPESAIGQMLKADIYLVKGNFGEALKSNLQAYQIKPNGKLLSTIISLMVKQEKIPEGVELLKKELSKNPDSSELHFNLAVLYQQQGDITNAINHYQAVLKADPENIRALNNLALVYQQQNNPQAITLARKAYNSAPDSGFIADTYGYMLLNKGKSQEALIVLKKAAELAPKHLAIQFHLAQAYVAVNDNKQAIATLRPIVKERLNYSEKESAIQLLEKLTDSNF